MKSPIIVRNPPKIIEIPTASENKKYAVIDAIIGSHNGKDATIVGWT